MSVKHNDDLYWLKEFGYRLKRLIHIKGITQGDFAKELGVTESTLSGYITGAHVPNALKIRHMARILDCDVNILFDETF